MKKFKKKLSGMTLVEMIISMAIFAVLALVLVTMGTAVEKNTRAANSLNKKVAVDGPVAEMQNTKRSYVSSDSHVIKVANAAQVQTNADGSWSGGYIAIEGTRCFVKQDDDGNAVTNAVTTNAEGASSIVVDGAEEAGDFDFNFIIVPKPIGKLASDDDSEGDE